MLGLILQFSSIAQLPLAQAGQLLLVVGISFVILTVISSTYRFHIMIQLSEEALTTVEDCNDFFFVQVTRYLSKINRTSSGFGVFVVQFLAEAQTNGAYKRNCSASSEKLSGAQTIKSACSAMTAWLPSLIPKIPAYPP